MIPLSSKVEKYRKIMNKIITSKNYCDLIHIVKLDNNKESVFLIQDIFPITEKYIDREYTIAGNHLKITAIHSVNEIEKKAKKVIKLIKNGVIFTPTQPNVKNIINKIQNDMN